MSGRNHTLAKGATSNIVREFESLSLRHRKTKREPASRRFPFCFSVGEDFDSNPCEARFAISRARVSSKRSTGSFRRPRVSLSPPPKNKKGNLPCGSSPFCFLVEVGLVLTNDPLFVGILVIAQHEFFTIHGEVFRCIGQNRELEGIERFSV